MTTQTQNAVEYALSQLPDLTKHEGIRMYQGFPDPGRELAQHLANEDAESSRILTVRFQNQSRVNLVHAIGTGFLEAPSQGNGDVKKRVLYYVPADVWEKGRHVEVRPTDTLSYLLLEAR